MRNKNRRNPSKKLDSPAGHLARAIPKRSLNNQARRLGKEAQPKAGMPAPVKRLLWGIVTAVLVAPAFIFGKQVRGEVWDWAEVAGASAVMFVVFLFLATVRDYQK